MFACKTSVISGMQEEQEKRPFIQCIIDRPTAEHKRKTLQIIW